MGHTSFSRVRSCSRICSASAVVVTVRNPYDHLASRYNFALTMRAMTMRSEPGNGDAIYNAIRTLSEQQQDAILGNFTSYLQYISTHYGWALQSGSLKKACGEPCAYDELLRTESLSDDYKQLLEKYGKSGPLLESKNPSTAYVDVHQLFGAASCENIKAVNRLEATIFSQFDYKKKSCLRRVKVDRVRRHHPS